MTKYSVTLCIPHVNSFELLKLCLACIHAHQHPKVDARIVIVEQSAQPVFQQVVELARSYDPDGSRVIVTPAKQVDAGWPIDIALLLASGEYFCSLDCDMFVLHPAWLYLPARMITDRHCVWCGFNTKLEWAYKDKGPFIALNNYYRVCRTDLARRISQDVGFLRPESRTKVGFVPRDTSWEKTPGNHGSDNGVVAQWYADQVLKSGPKLALARNGWLGGTPQWGAYGDSMDDLALHLCFAQTITECRDKVATLGKEYLELRERFESGKVTVEEVKDLHKRIKGGSKARHIDDIPISAELNAKIDAIKAGKE